MKKLHRVILEVVEFTKKLSLVGIDTEEYNSHAPLLPNFVYIGIRIAIQLEIDLRRHQE